MRIRLVVIAGLVILLAIGLGSYAAAEGGKKNVEADLNGYLEVPPVSSSGVGQLKAEIEPVSIGYTLIFSGLEGPTTLFAHLHFGQRSVSGGISAFL